MLQIRTRPSPIEQVARAVEDTADHASEMVAAVSDRAGQELAASDLDLGAVRAGVRQALTGVDAECCAELETARDKERLKAALIAGVVLFALSAVVFVIAREIAARRARIATTTLRPPLTPRGMAVVEEGATDEGQEHPQS